MKIGSGAEASQQVNPSQAEAIAGRAQKPLPPGQAEHGGVLQGDQATVSSTGVQIAQSSSVSDVRLDKVASIQSALRAGTYQVPASEVAHKVVDSLLQPK